MEKHLFIRVAQYAYDYPKGFTYFDLVQNKIIEGEAEEKIMRKHFENATHKGLYDAKSTLETMFLALDPVADYTKSKCILTFEAYFDYFDYLEFQEARKMSQQAINSSIDATNLAKKSIFYAKWALILSIVFSICGIIVQIWSTFQPTKINDNQFSEVKNLISSEIKQ